MRSVNTRSDAALYAQLLRMDAIADNIRRLRESRGWKTQGALGERLGCRSATVSDWETGKSRPGPEYMSKLLELFGITEAQLRSEAAVDRILAARKAESGIRFAEPTVREMGDRERRLERGRAAIAEAESAFAKETDPHRKQLIRLALEATIKSVLLTNQLFPEDTDDIAADLARRLLEDEPPLEEQRGAEQGGRVSE